MRIINLLFVLQLMSLSSFAQKSSSGTIILESLNMPARDGKNFEVTFDLKNVRNLKIWACTAEKWTDEIILEVGIFEAYLNLFEEWDETPFVLLDGANKGFWAQYERKGIDHRWDWGEKREYALVINPKGEGLYYDFSNVIEGEKTTPQYILSCQKQK
jgi:hypothetical protein